MEETIERLNKQVAKGGGIAFVVSVIGKGTSFGLHIPEYWAIGLRALYIGDKVPLCQDR